VGKLQGDYNNEEIDYLKELIKGNRALVRTVIHQKNVDISVDYRFKKVDGAWKVYDIIIAEGVSLVKNYRVQFSSILKKGSPGQLIERLEIKLAEQTGSI
jgi:phospholipid transport system substrate-binding protein